DTLNGEIEDVWTPLREAFDRGPVIVGNALDAEMDLDMDMPSDMPGALTVLGYEEAQQVLDDPETYSSTIYAEIMGVVMGHSMLEMDGNEHDLHRALVSQASRRK